jgi:DNA invertase Pin-like site-specific DNA recombinase
MKSVPPDVARRLAGIPCILYGRVSTGVQESDGYSLPSQRRDGRKTAAQLRAPIVAEDFEQGSGQDWDLSGIANTMRLAKEGRIKLMIVKNISRFSRDIGKQAWLEHQLKEAGVEIFYFDEQYDDTPTGRFARDMVGRAGQWQLEISRELSMQARLDKVTDFGRPVGNGQLPYGWRRIRDERGAKKRTIAYEHDPAEVAVIRRFRDLTRMSTRAFCDQLNAEGIPSPGKWRASEERPRCGKWGISSIHHIVNNPMTWGEYRYGLTEVKKGRNGKIRHVPKPDAEPVTLQLEAILTKAEVNEIKAALSSRANRPGRLRTDDDADPYVLRGVFTCALCGSTLATRSNGDAASPYRTYRCLRSIPAVAKRYHASVCATPALIANTRPERSGGEGIEDMVWRAVPELLDEATIRAAIERSREADGSAETHAERVAFVRKAIETKTKSLNIATQRLSEATDDLDRDSFAATRESLKSEIRALRASLEGLEAYVPSGVSRDEEEGIVALVGEMRDALEDATSAERRELLRRLRIRGTVTPDPEGAYQIGRHRYAIAWGGVFDLGQVLVSPVQNMVMF